MDMEAEHKELQLRNVWSQAERELFREKYLQHPKNFGQIASFLPRKSVRDCVRYVCHFTWMKSIPTLFILQSYVWKHL